MNKLSADCKSCKNLNCLIKKHTNNEAISNFLDEKVTISCKKDQTFILEGAPVHGLFFIYKGRAKVAKTGINGREQIVRFVGDGEIMGHRGFGSGHFYQVNAVALENTTLCNFNNDILHEMLMKIPEMTYSFMQFYADELNRSETKVKKFAQMTVREKVIDAILYINRKFGLKNGFLTLPLSRKEIADFAGTTDEQVIRIISALKKEGLLKTQGRKIGIPDVSKLKKEIADHNFFLDS